MTFTDWNEFATWEETEQFLLTVKRINEQAPEGEPYVLEMLLRIREVRDRATGEVLKPEKWIVRHRHPGPDEPAL